ncbi:MAG: hypothetical protein LUE86_03045, partial [Clostridiales bacterium]|nr:hypothetical protein [Clostridiales bacterium]
MPETRREAREKMDFNQLLDEMYVGKASKRYHSSKEFIAVRDALQEVEILQDSFVGRDSGPHMEEAHKLLGEACEAYINARKGAITGKGKDRLELVNVIYDLQKKETATIDTWRDPSKYAEHDKHGGIKWGAVMGQSRVTEINVTGKELTTVGAGSSTRTVVPLENNRKGFFTPDQIRQNEDDFLQERINTATSENVKEAYKGLSANEHAFFMLSTAAQSSLAENDFDTALSNYIVNPETGKINEGYESTHKAIGWKALSENPADMAEFLKGAKECGKFKTSSEVLEDGGVAIGANMPVRNVASSRLAALLGQGALLAKSELVSLRDGNKIQKGVMMEEAVGMDWNARENRETFGRANDFTDPNLQRQLSTLEVMDYLAGQIDRNIGNMFYRFDKDTPGKLIGIQGIDYDAAFGKFVPVENQYIREFVNINNIKFIYSD